MAYKEWKAQEKLKNLYKEAFFSLADEAVQEQGLAVQYVAVEAKSEAVARARAERHHPGWVIDEIRAHRVKTDVWEVILGEDARLKSFVCEHEGVKYARQVSRGPTLLDDEWLAEADPALYGEVTFELPWGQVLVRPLEQFDAALLGRLKKYLYADKPRVTLAPPRTIQEPE